MPSKSAKQAHLMAAVAHNPAFAKKVGIPQSVGKDFNKADKGKKFREGGTMKASTLFKGKETYGEELKEAKAIKSGKITPEQYARGEKMEDAKKPKKMAAGGSTGRPYQYPDSTPVDEPTTKVKAKPAVKASPVKYPKDVPVDEPVKYARGGGIESRGKTKGTIVKMATGGFVRAADGVAQRGKTKAKQVTMKRGGMC